jgi:branched-chain amino acid transport system substrate-binding protein
MKLKRILAISVCSFMVLGLVTGCKSNSTTAKGTITIGVSAPITGEYAADGLLMTEGINLAVSEINAAGGVLGKNLKVITEDDQAAQASAVNAVNILMSSNVVAVIGPHFSTCVQATDPIFAKNKIPYITGGTSLLLEQANDSYFFRVRACDSLIAPSMAKYAVETLKAKNIGIMYNNDAMGTGAIALIEPYLKSKGVSYTAEGHNTGDKDFTATLAKMKNAGIDTLLTWTHDAETAGIAKQVLQLGMTNLNKLSSTSFSMDSVEQLAGKDAAEGWYCAADYINATTDPKQLAFEKAFKAKYNATAELYASTYYSATYVLADAIKRANSTNPSQIDGALHATTNYPGLLGPLTADAKGDMLHQMNIAQIKNLVPQLVGNVKS